MEHRRMKKRLALLIPLLVGAAFWGFRAESPGQLVAQLDGPEGVKVFARLAQRDDEEALRAIIEGTHHSSPRVRAQCARLLGDRQDVTLVPHLEAMLADKDEGVSGQAARALVSLLDEQELMEMLPGTPRSPAAQRVLLQGTLGQSNCGVNGAMLDWCLDRRHSAELRTQACLALRDSTAPEAGQARQRILREARKEAFDPACPGAPGAVQVYAWLRGPAAVEEILPLTRSPVAELSQGAYQALSLSLARGKGEAARLRVCNQARRNAFDDRCPRHGRIGGLQLYLSLGGPASLEEVQPLIRSADSSLAEAAVVAVASTRDDRAATILCPLFQEKGLPLNVRVAAVGSLVNFRWNAQALETARLALNDPEPRVRAAAASSLAMLGDKNSPDDSRYGLAFSIEPVKKALASEADPQTRGALNNALSALEGRLATRQKR